MPLALTAMIEGTYPPAFVDEFERTTAMIEELFEDRRREPRDDFISGLVEAADDGFQVSHEEMVGNTLAVYAGAQLATATSVGMVLLNLATHPDQYAELRTEPELATGAVEESLRHDPAGLFGFPRYATQDTAVGGRPVRRRNAGPGRPGRRQLRSGALSRPLPVRPPSAGTRGAVVQHRCTSVPRLTRRAADSDHRGRWRRGALDAAGSHARPDFSPVYGGVLGELKPATLPLTATA